MDYGGASGVPGRAEEAGALELAGDITAICQNAHSNAGKKSHLSTEGPRLDEYRDEIYTQ